MRNSKKREIPQRYAWLALWPISLQVLATKMWCSAEVSTLHIRPCSPIVQSEIAKVSKILSFLSSSDSLKHSQSQTISIISWKTRRILRRETCSAERKLCSCASGLFTSPRTMERLLYLLAEKGRAKHFNSCDLFTRYKENRRRKSYLPTQIYIRPERVLRYNFLMFSTWVGPTTGISLMSLIILCFSLRLMTKRCPAWAR